MDTVQKQGVALAAALVLSVAFGAALSRFEKSLPAQANLAQKPAPAASSGFGHYIWR